ncbi:hypothetical protein [Nocardia jiangxiensis]|uniref:hypothetical protein n=1 Tax=Nocardia jiangxiensis TaxID=282685 RepID=UPI0003008D33|nr:hypothetical protein [Nocardia jiangxiensis]
MTTLKIDPDTYYNAAKKLILLADQAVLPFIALHNNLHDNGGMAGNYQGVEAWTSPYDTQAQDFHQAYIAYINALNHFGDILNATGYNWDIGNYNADKNPHKGKEPDKPTVATELLVEPTLPTPPSAKSANTAPGLDEGPLHGLLAKITHPVPNGDLGKLAAVHSTWDNFAEHNAVTSAQGAIKQLIDTFTDQGTVDPHLPRIQEYLTDLSTAAGNLAQASTAITNTVANHHDQLSTLRGNIQRDRTGALIAIGATVITAGLLWCLTVVATDGAGAAATGVEVDAALAATDAEITTAAAAITSDITASTLPALLADGTEIFSGIRQFTKADAQILAIQALVVAMASGDSAQSQSSDGEDLTAKAKKVRDIVTDSSGNLIGDEDATGVRIVSEAELEKAHQELEATLGKPEVKVTPKGNIEVWKLSGDPKSTVTYRPFSASGGETLDFNDVPNVPTKRWHIK